MVQTLLMPTLTVLPYLELHGEFLMINWLRRKLPQYLAPSKSGLPQSPISNKEHPWNLLWREVTLSDDYFCLSTLSTQRNSQNYGSIVSHGQGLMVTLDGQSESHSVMSDPLWPHGLYSPRNSPGQNTGVGSPSLLQWIFLTQGSNRGLPRCRQILYQLSHQGNPVHISSLIKISDCRLFVNNSSYLGVVVIDSAAFWSVSYINWLAHYPAGHFEISPPDDSVVPQCLSMNQ